VRFKNVFEPVEVFEIVSEGHMGAVADAAAMVDPVCHMHVEAVTAPARLPFNGKTYYFCSFQCAEVFTKHPPAYLEP
jgi:P-type Cu+ transporter